jgi:hypothetical protein
MEFMISLVPAKRGMTPMTVRFDPALFHLFAGVKEGLTFWK